MEETMADEQTSESQPEVNETSTEESRMQNALNLLGQNELEQVNEENLIEDQQKEVEPEKQKDDRSEYYAKLVEKDKEIRQLRSQVKGGPDYKSLAKENPIKVLQELGIGMDQVIEMWVNGSQTQNSETTQEPKTNEEIAQLRQELNQIKQERQQMAMQQAYNNEIGKIYNIVNKEGEDKWELVKTTNNYELVMETAIETYKLNPDETPDYESILDAVESHLEEHYGNIYQELSKINKLQSKFAVKSEQKIPERVKVELNKAPIPGPTLSTTHSSDTPTPRGFSEQERFQRALQVLEQSGD
jgi:hypothetical protein